MVLRLTLCHDRNGDSKSSDYQPLALYQSAYWHDGNDASVKRRIVRPLTSWPVTKCPLARWQWRFGQKLHIVRLPTTRPATERPLARWQLGWTANHLSSGNSALEGDETISTTLLSAAPCCSAATSTCTCAWRGTVWGRYGAGVGQAWGALQTRRPAPARALCGGVWGRCDPHLTFSRPHLDHPHRIHTTSSPLPHHIHTYLRHSVTADLPSRVALQAKQCVLCANHQVANLHAQQADCQVAVCGVWGVDVQGVLCANHQVADLH
eukprot:353481-Chlamydomonas_euryale.AAC.1